VAWGAALSWEGRVAWGAALSWEGQGVAWEGQGPWWAQPWGLLALPVHWTRHPPASERVNGILPPGAVASPWEGPLEVPAVPPAPLSVDPPWAHRTLPLVADPWVGLVVGVDLVGVGPRPCPPPPSPSLARQRADAVCARGPSAPLTRSPDHGSCSATPPAPLVSAVVQAGSEAGRGCASPPLYLPFTISLENGCTSPGAGRSAPAAGQGEPSPTFPARR
jgi:hypothetical protein